MTNNRIRTLVFLLLLAFTAFGQAAGDESVVLDLPAAVVLAQARETHERDRANHDKPPLDDFRRQQECQRLFRDIAVGSDDNHPSPRRVGGAGNVTAAWIPAGTSPVAGSTGGGAGTIGGFLGLLHQQRQVANAQQTLDLLLRMIVRVEADRDAGLVDIAQVDVFRWNIQLSRANLLVARVAFETSMDQFKIDQLGLPSDLPVLLDDTMIRQFDLVDATLEGLQTSLAELVNSILNEQDDPTVEQVAQATERVAGLREEIGASLRDAHAEVDALVSKAEVRSRTMTDDEQRSYAFARRHLEKLSDFESHFAQSLDALEALRASLATATVDEAAQGLLAYCDCLSNLTCQISLVPSLARLESITVEPIEISAVDALRIAHSHRLDWLKQCAALGEIWRSLADQEYTDAEGIATYQTARRALVATEGHLNGALRQDLRALVQLRKNFEIQREAVANAMIRVANTCETLTKPRPEASLADADTAVRPNPWTNLSDALQALSDAQINILAIYLQHYKHRLDLSQELGVMRFDEGGKWIDEPLDRNLAEVEPAFEVPPEINAGQRPTR